MNLLRDILKNTFFLSLGTLVSRILMVFFVALLARTLGPVGVGTYSFVLALIAVFMILPNFGFDTLLVREVSKSKDGKSEFVLNIINIKLLLALVASFLLISFIILKRYDTEMLQIMLLLLLSGIFHTILSSFYSIFRAHEKMELEAILTIINRLLRVLFGIVAIKIGLGLSSIVSALVLGDALSVLCALYITNRKFIRIKLLLPTRMIKNICLAAVPFGVLTVIDVVFLNTDYLMIANLQSESAVGWYAAASKLLGMIYLIPSMFMLVIFPVLSRLSVLSSDLLRQTYSKSFYYLLMISIPIAVGGFLVSDQIILGIYGQQFRNSILIFQVMVWLVIFNFVGWINGTTLNASGREKMFAATWSCFALANIVLDYIFIKRFGYIGACYVTLILNGIDFFLYSIICHRQLSVKIEWPIIWKSLVASITMGGIIFILKGTSISVFILILIGAFTYIGMIFVLRTLPREDVIAIRKLAVKHSV